MFCVSYHTYDHMIHTTLLHLYTKTHKIYAYMYENNKTHYISTRYIKTLVVAVFLYFNHHYIINTQTHTRTHLSPLTFYSCSRNIYHILKAYINIY